MQSLYRYVITNRLGMIQANPLGEANFIIEWTRQDDGELDYKSQLPSKIIFKNEVYANLLKLETSQYRCDFVNISVERFCSGSWAPWFSGRLSFNDATWDLDSCSVEVKLDDIKPDQCYDDNKTTELNLFEIPFRRFVYLNPTNITLEKVTYSGSGGAGSQYCNGQVWGGTGDPFAQNWRPYFYAIDATVDGSGNPALTFCAATTKWAREVVVVGCGDPPPGPDWLLVEDTCPGGSQKYARYPRTYGCTFLGPDYGAVHQTTEYSCKVIGDADVNFTIDNGLALEDVINFYLNQFCPGTRFTSNFFQINPDVLSSINYVTGQRSKTAHLTFFQKSDVKRPTATGNATIAMLAWSKLMEYLVNTYNLAWRFEGNRLRMEHISFFAKAPGIDLTDPKYSKWIVGKRVYSYDVGEIPAQEVFKWMEAGPGDFTGVPISYTGCITATNRDVTKNYTVDKITTDVELCLSNPDPDSKIVSDQGFVLMACDFDGTNYFIITEASILGGSSVNNTLAWAQLHRDYWKYNRPLLMGTMNNVLTQFLSTKPTKKGVEITFPLCCGDNFFPDDLIKTPLGQGVVDKATYSFKDETLKVELLYPADFNLTQNVPPVATNDAVSTPQDAALVINVLANDFDPDGGAITAVRVLIPPIHGTAVVNPDKSITYTPATGFTGFDFFAYKIYDNWSQESNYGTVSITVVAANQPPIARPDFYVATKNTALHVPPDGVFANDSDDAGFSLNAYDHVSVNGGTVVLNPDNSFDYTPATGFVGTDTFTYQIIDAGMLTSTATVTIDVRDPLNPVANDDGIYQTRKNQNLTVAAPGVLGNDTTGIGSLTAGPSSSLSVHGGTITMASDGSFTYSPPPDYVGLDSFVYTASNGTGSDMATVTIRVLPDIYAHLQQMTANNNYLSIDCDGHGAPGGNTQDGIFRVFLYSDSAGSIPLDISGLNIQFNIGVTGTPPGSFSTIGSGTQFDLFGGTSYIYYYRYLDCHGVVTDFRNQSIILQAGLYTII